MILTFQTVTYPLQWSNKFPYLRDQGLIQPEYKLYTYCNNFCVVYPSFMLVSLTMDTWGEEEWEGTTTP